MVINSIVYDTFTVTAQLVTSQCGGGELGRTVAGGELGGGGGVWTILHLVDQSSLV